MRTSCCEVVLCSFGCNIVPDRWIPMTHNQGNRNALCCSLPWRYVAQTCCHNGAFCKAYAWRTHLWLNFHNMNERSNIPPFLLGTPWLVNTVLPRTFSKARNSTVGTADHRRRHRRIWSASYEHVLVELASWEKIAVPGRLILPRHTHRAGQVVLPTASPHRMSLRRPPLRIQRL